MRSQFYLERIPYLADLISIFFPKLCLICQQQSTLRHHGFCFACQQKLPFTNFHLTHENAFTDRFWGRIPLQAGAALFFLQKDGVVQEIVYQLKYNDRPKIGIQLGRLYGKILKNHSVFAAADLILPVPLHPSRNRKRGYNQSTQFAIGLSEILHIPVNDTALIRTIATTTQTKKTRLERFENVLSAFQVRDRIAIANKHILLVDDVLTTGATLEACATHLLEIEGVTMSMLTIAIAKS